MLCFMPGSVIESIIVSVVRKLWCAKLCRHFGIPAISGYHTLVVAVYGYHVVAFEGMEENIKILRANLCDNPNLASLVTFFPVGLGAGKQTCKIMINKYNRGDGVVRCPGLGNQHQQQVQPSWNQTIVGELKLHPLDSFIKQPVQVMKMDVEGFEPHVAAGAQQLLEVHGVKYLIFEFTPELLRQAGVQPRQWIDRVHGLGYKCSNVSIDGPWLTEPDIADVVQYGSEAGMEEGRHTPVSTDLFCVHGE
jgi:FkbM family methyltransferase